MMPEKSRKAHSVYYNFGIVVSNFDRIFKITKGKILFYLI
jgi:hypothetical protein